jgi:hypothetical protein
MADPTGARQRTINSFFDSPRFPIKLLPVIPVTAGPPPPPPPPPPPAAAPAGAAAPPPPPPPKPAAPPKLTLYLPASGSRSVRRFLDAGLNFKVTANQPLGDADVRLFEVVGTQLRPMGSAFRVAPGPEGATVRVEATRFARSKLHGSGARTFRAIARGTGRDGQVGTTSATFRVT